MSTISGIALILATIGSAGAQSFSAAPKCSKNEDCGSSGGTTTIGFISRCLPSGECSNNPFEQGCLVTMAKIRGEDNPINILERRIFNQRQCNSNDLDTSTHDNKICLMENYGVAFPEIRIAPGKWDSSVVSSWIYQILLSELMNVPTTLEFGGDEHLKSPRGSFYDPESRLEFSDTSYRFDALKHADELDGYCENAKRPCAHVLPELWDGARKGMKEAQEESYALKDEPTGLVGENGYYIPLYTGKSDPTLLSYLGLQGQENRAKLADTFRTPTTWKDYCSEVTNSTPTCEAGDPIADRAPKTEVESESYFVSDLYKGHFRILPENNCDDNPNSCTGHFVNPHCDRSTYAEMQMYWNNIALQSTGPLMPNSGYHKEHMIQIWKAANATKSNVVMRWLRPDYHERVFSGTPAAMTRISLPTPTDECIEYRHTELEKCADDFETRIGDEVGSCDYALVSIKRLLSRGLETRTNKNEKLAFRSPDYEFLTNIQFSPFSMDKVFSDWANLSTAHVYSSREEVCSWVYDNIDELAGYVPNGYPREWINMKSPGLSTSALVISVIALIFALSTAACVYKFRKSRAINLSQVNCIAWVSCGYTCVATAAILSALPPSLGVCTSTQWFTRLGYTIELVPTLIKVSTINNIYRHAQRCERTEIDPGRFKKILVSTCFCVIIFLTVWTVLDAPSKRETYLIEQSNLHQIQIFDGCQSDSQLWLVTSFAWEAVLLVTATILTFQSRDVIEDLSNTQGLAFMVYSHFLFLVVRILVLSLQMASIFKPPLAGKVISLCLSIDTISSTLVYFGPKFIAAHKETTDQGKPVTRVIKKGNGGGRRIISGLNLPPGDLPDMISRSSMISRASIISQTKNVKTNQDGQYESIRSNEAEHGSLGDTSKTEETSVFPVLRSSMSSLETGENDLSSNLAEHARLALTRKNDNIVSSPPEILGIISESEELSGVSVPRSSTLDRVADETKSSY